VVNDLSKLTRDDIKKEIKLSKKSQSYEYSSFMNEKVERKSWYELACKKVGEIFPNFKLTKKEEFDLSEKIRKSDLNVTAVEVSVFSLIVLIYYINI